MFERVKRLGSGKRGHAPFAMILGTSESPDVEFAAYFSKYDVVLAAYSA